VVHSIESLVCMIQITVCLVIKSNASAILVFCACLVRVMAMFL
jgi:hypothetical protein